MRAFLIGLIIFLYGCGDIVEENYIEIKKSVAWRNLMPSPGKKEKKYPLIVKVYLKEKNANFNLSIKKAEIIYEGGICVDSKVVFEKNNGEPILVLRGCDGIPFNINSLKIKIILEDNKGNFYKIEKRDIHIRKIY